jgi:outer membrane biosynthesis protein TonB
MNQREAFRKREARKRGAASIIITTALYGAAASLILLLSAMSETNLGGESGPIKVRIGSPEGALEESMATLFQDQPDTPPAEEEIPPEEVALPEELPETPPPPDEATLAALPPPPSAAPEKPSPQPSPKASPRASPKASARPASQRPAASSASAASPQPAASASPQAAPAAVVMRGSESGNAWETSFEAGSGFIGRSLYVPIYLYMPLPYEIDSATFEAIGDDKAGFATAESRRAAILSHYRKEESSYILKAPAPFDARPLIWLALEDAGFPVTKAGYKRDKYLRPVVIRFRVGSTKGGEAPLLEQVELKKSSGYSDVDEAVLYGFKKAAFSNDSPRSVWGTFTYTFD